MKGKYDITGVPVAYVAPQYSSRVCSKCGLIGARNGKKFHCVKKHVEHADVNAAFNLSVWSDDIAQSYAERDVYEGSWLRLKEQLHES